MPPQNMVSAFQNNSLDTHSVCSFAPERFHWRCCKNGSGCCSSRFCPRKDHPHKSAGGVKQAFSDLGELQRGFFCSGKSKEETAGYEADIGRLLESPVPAGRSP